MATVVRKGFTLIEIMVVISIIGLLSSIILVAVNGARVKTRDSKRTQDLIQIRNALDLYYSVNGKYPSTGGIIYSSRLTAIGAPQHINSCPSNDGDWIPGLVASKIISQLPTDPLGDVNPACSWNRQYLYLSTNGAGYVLQAYCAPEKPSTGDTFRDSLQTDSWKVCSGTDCLVR